VTLRFLQNALSLLPPRMQFALRRANFGRKIRAGQFLPDEPELIDVTRWLRPGDWVVDVGANVGRYTCHMSRCVGPTGRVLAFEPIPESFALLTANVYASGATNVSLFNIALSSASGMVSMTVPYHDHTRLNNYYQAHIAPTGDYQVVCMPLDVIPVLGRVRLVKVDVEGHDLQVLEGMQSLLRRDCPLLIVEGSRTGSVASWLREQGYVIRKTEGSPNIVGQPPEGQKNSPP
jgi:FkbM family methyltransferase